MKIKNSLIVCYKKPASYRILEIMREYRLFEADNLLNNIEKVIPVSKVITRNKEVKKILYEDFSGTILFYIYV